MYKRIISFLMVTFMMVGMVSLPVSAAAESEEASDSSVEQGQITETVQMSWLDALLRLDDEKTAYTIQDSLCVEVSTNEKVYQENDAVEVTIRVQNSNEIKIKNLSLTPVLPKGYKLAEEEKAELAVKTLPVGKSVTLTVECVPDNLPEMEVIWQVCLGVVAVAGAIGTVVLFVKKKKLPAILPATLTVAALAGILVLSLGKTEKQDEREQIALSTNVTVAETEYAFGATVRYEAIEIDPDTVLVEYVTFLSDDLVTNADEFYAIRVKKGNTVPEPPVPQAQIMEFMGWYKDMEYAEPFDFSEPVSEATYLYAKWEMDETDTDGEGFFDVLENYYGTNVNAADTDTDGLNDYIEFNIKTSPFLADTDEDGVLDYDEDADGDKLTNGEEAGLGTEAALTDTDIDGLDDYQEVKEYGTNPCLADSDGDGLDDYSEIAGGFDPLKKNKKFAVSAASEEVSEYNPVAAKVELNLAGEQVTTLNVEQITMADNPMVRSTLPGYMGPAYDFTVDGEIEEATLVFTYDAAMYGEPDEDFQPRIYYLNEETKLYEELKNQVVENGVVKAKTTHFSTYILLNKTEFDKIWETSIRPPEYTGEDQKSGLDVVLLLDSSGSMEDNDPEDLRKEAAKLFLDKLKAGDSAAVIPFTSEALSYGTLSDNMDSLKSQIDAVGAKGGTNFSNPIKEAIDLLSAEENQKYKYIILFTDGEGDYNTKYTKQAKEKGIVIFTIGLGKSVSSSKLKNMSDGTGGSYFHVSSADGINAAFEETSKATIDYITDTNNDGISDYYENLLKEGGIPYGDLFYGFDFGANDDYDGDGLKNGEEIQVVEKDERVYLITKSDPRQMNSDMDGMTDYEEMLAGTNPYLYTVSKETKELLFDEYNFYHSGTTNYFEEHPVTMSVAAFCYGVFLEREDIYKNTIIDFLQNYASEDYIRQRSLELEVETFIELLSELACEMTSAITDLNEIPDALHSQEEYVKEICKFIDELKIVKLEIIDMNNNVTQDFFKIDLENKVKDFRKKAGEKLQAGIDLLPENNKTKFLKRASSKFDSIFKTIDKANKYFDWMMLASDISSAIATYSSINVNDEMFEQARAILTDLAMNGRSEKMRSAAKDILKQLDEKNSSMKKEVVSIILEFGFTKFKDGLEKALEQGGGKAAKYLPILSVASFTKETITLINQHDENMEQFYQMVTYGELGRSTTNVLGNKIVAKGAYFEEKESAQKDICNVRTYFVYLMNLRITGEQKYLDLIKKEGLIEWIENEEASRKNIEAALEYLKSIAEQLNLPVAE